jgi:Protein of unknown function (DUF1367)
MKGIWRRIGMTAVPAGNEGREALLSVRDGATFMADTRGARNPDQHELFWTLCTVVADAEDEDKDNIKRWLLWKLNFVDIWFDPQGSMHTETQSIAFESMEQAKFARFMNAAIPLMSERLGAAPREFRARFEELLDPEMRAKYRQLKEAA